MTTPVLSSLHVYPIKSSADISISSAWVDEYGLSFDRRFVLSDLQGQFMTARKHHNICLIQSNIVPEGLMIKAPNMPNIIIKYEEISAQYQTVGVWRDNIEAQVCHSTVNNWLSTYLQQPCQLLFFGEHSKRQVKNSKRSVAFPDAYPLLLISKASLVALNKRSKRNNTMKQFRPNIVIDKCDTFDEDSWHKIQIGEVTFDVVSPCSRCILTTIDPETASPDSSQEPLATLKTFRQGQDGELYFGQNLIPLNKGHIKAGDKVTVISRKTPEIYPEIQVPASNNEMIADETLNSPTAINLNPPINKENNVSKKINIKFDSWNIDYQGNNQETLLDQGEDAGLIMHYSCRGGNCGRCKVKLQSGDVEQLATDGLMPDEQADGYILACSSIPKSDVIVTKN